MGGSFVSVQFHTLSCKHKATTKAVYSSDVVDDYHVRGLYGFVFCVSCWVSSDLRSSPETK
jgi:hypothetical protein